MGSSDLNEFDPKVKLFYTEVLGQEHQDMVSDVTWRICKINWKSVIVGSKCFISFATFEI